MSPRAVQLRGIESLLHFPYVDSTERVIFVKALRFAPTAGAAPTSGGLDKAPFYAPVFASSYGKNEEKNWEELGQHQQQHQSRSSRMASLRPCSFILCSALLRTRSGSTHKIAYPQRAAALRAAFKNLQKGRKIAWKQQNMLDVLHLLLYKYLLWLRKQRPQMRRDGEDVDDPNCPREKLRGAWSLFALPLRI
jgi:hypothetical protein